MHTLLSFSRQSLKGADYLHHVGERRRWLATHVPILFVIFSIRRPKHWRVLYESLAGIKVDESRMQRICWHFGSMEYTGSDSVTHIASMKRSLNLLDVNNLPGILNDGVRLMWHIGYPVAFPCAAPGDRVLGI